MKNPKNNPRLAELEAQMQEVYNSIWAAPTFTEREERSKCYAELKKEYERLTDGTDN